MKKLYLFSLILFCLPFLLKAKTSFDDSIYDYNIKMGDYLYQNHDFFQNLETAINYYKNAITLNKNNTDAYWKLARALWVKQEKSQNKKQKKEILVQARSYLKESFAQYPQNIDIRLWKAIINGSYVRNSGFFDSLLFLTRDIKKDIEFVLAKRKDSARALVVLGAYYYYLPIRLGGDLEKAISLFQQALEISPKFHRANLYLAKVYYKKKQILFAVENLSTVLKAKDSEEIAFLYLFQQEAYTLLTQYQSENEDFK